jgi:drug/metabolite transporter (DMT)-like permease|tara:strand:- start:706 stop:1563 length:858 start_codon:yes stop_codon:yes gene_type:complete
MKATSLPILLMIGAVFCFASMDATAKYLMKEIGPAQTIWARYTVQAVIVTVLILPKINVYGRTNYPKLQFLRSVALMMATTLFFFAFSKLGLAEASAIFNISPVLITLGAFLFLREQIGPRRLIGIIVSLLGALIIIRPGTGVFSIYALLPLGAAIFYSTYSLATRFVGTDESPWTSLFYSAIFGAICYSIYIAFYWNPMSNNAILLTIIIGLFGTAGHICLIRALTLGEASLVAPFIYTNLLFTTTWGFVLFGNLPDFWTIVGALIIVAAGIYVWARDRAVRPI